jgi:hypothetical protein
MLSPDPNEKVLRLLEEAAKQIVRAAAELQAKGIDTAPLSRPVLMLGDAIKELAQSSSSSSSSSLSSEAVVDEQLADSMASTMYNSDQQSKA